MMVVNTTVGWQVGDDLIREGCFELLGVDPSRDPVYLVNRAQIAGRPHDACWEPMHARQRGNPSPRDVMRHASLFLCAGTPEWAAMAEDWWEAAIEHSVPIVVLGAGMNQGDEAKDVVTRAAGLVRYATARDDAARRFLDSCGVQAEKASCPSTALFTPRPGTRRVVVPRLSCAGRAVGTEQQAFWWRVAHSVRSGEWGEVEVAVHEPAEIRAAADLFGQAPLYSSDWSFYRRLYQDCEWVLAGRLHAALPAMAGGASVELLDAAPKFRGVVVDGLVPVGSVSVGPTLPGDADVWRAEGMAAANYAVKRELSDVLGG